MENEKIKSKIGLMVRGQAWVELDGIFYSEELRIIADNIDKLCLGLENKNGNKE